LKINVNDAHFYPMEVFEVLKVEKPQRNESRKPQSDKTKTNPKAKKKNFNRNKTSKKQV
jgi:hypothetical protein